MVPGHRGFNIDIAQKVGKAGECLPYAEFVTLTVLVDQPNSVCPLEVGWKEICLWSGGSL